MEMLSDPPKPSSAERLARAAAVGFLLLALVTLAFALGWGVQELRQDDSAPAAPATSARNETSSGASVGAAVIDEIVNLLQTQYVDRKVIDPDALKDAAINGIITSLNDRETHYISPDELRSSNLQLASSYEGIGASVSDRTGQIQIVAPFRDSPAEKAGIKTGDIILEVNGERTDGWTDSHAVDQIRGPRGTTVTLLVQHTDGTQEKITVTRGEIDIESVFTDPNLEVIPGESKDQLVDRDGAAVTDVCYLAIAQFHDKTLSELKTKAANFASRCKGLILDVRGNPGGGLTATVNVADEFLDQGTIIIEQDSDGKQSTTSAQRGGLLTKIPIVVLQDSGSASGSEVLAAALRDNGRATILGTTSFGKGTVNRLFPLKNCDDPKGNCGALYASIGRWLTPKGELIEGLGVKPDIELPMTSEQYVDQGDIQVFRAIDILRGKK
ncbi:MAG: S41 family peptidase [Dehalococcoidia bacterium]